MILSNASKKLGFATGFTIWHSVLLWFDKIPAEVLETTSLITATSYLAAQGATDAVARYRQPELLAASRSGRGGIADDPE